MKFAQKPAVKIAVFIIATIIAVAIAMTAPPEGFEPKLMRFTGIFVWMIIVMLFSVFPDWLSMLMALVACAITGCATFSGAFTGFASSTLWNILLISGAIGAMTKTGVFKRIALKILTWFKPTYKNRILSMMVAGTVLAPLIPGEIKKETILQPMAVTFSRSAGFKDRSKPAAGLFTSAFVPAHIISIGFLTGSTLCYTLLGYIDAESASKFNWTFWAACCIVWVIIMLVGFYFFIIKYYKPENDAGDGIDVKAAYEALGPMSGNEKFSIVCLAIALIFWVFEAQIGVDAIYVSAVLFALVVVKGLFTNADLNTGIPWLVIFVSASILGIVTLCSTTGFATWISGILSPLFGPLASNLYLMVPVVIILTYILRFFIVSSNTIAIIMNAAFGSVLLSQGINPWIVVFVSYVSAYAFHVKFTALPFILTSAFCDGLVEHEDIVPSAIAFMVINFVGMMASIPVWQLLGIA